MFIATHDPRDLFAPLGAKCLLTIGFVDQHRRNVPIMANTFSQIYIQTVFAVSNRLSLIRPEFKEDLHKYITGIVRNQKQKLITINGMPDHLHILIGLKPYGAGRFST